MAKVIQVIDTTKRRGKGIDGDPMRIIQQYWSLEGKLLAEVDPFPDYLDCPECKHRKELEEADAKAIFEANAKEIRERFPPPHRTASDEN